MVHTLMCHLWHNYCSFSRTDCPLYHFHLGPQTRFRISSLLTTLTFYFIAVYPFFILILESVYNVCTSIVIVFSFNTSHPDHTLSSACEQFFMQVFLNLCCGWVWKSVLNVKCCFNTLRSIGWTFKPWRLIWKNCSVNNVFSKKIF